MRASDQNIKYDRKNITIDGAEQERNDVGFRLDVVSAALGMEREKGLKIGIDASGGKVRFDPKAKVSDRPWLLLALE
jgi:hypothetical protein